VQGEDGRVADATLRSPTCHSHYGDGTRRQECAIAVVKLLRSGSINNYSISKTYLNQKSID